MANELMNQNTKKNDLILLSYGCAKIQAVLIVIHDKFPDR